MTDKRTSPEPLNNRAPAPEPVRRFRERPKPCGCGKVKPARRVVGTLLGLPLVEDPSLNGIAHDIKLGPLP